MLTASEIRELYVEFNIPQEIVPVMPSEPDRACFHPKGYAIIYETHVMSGFHLPTPQELLDILTTLQKFRTAPPEDSQRKRKADAMIGGDAGAPSTDAAPTSLRQKRTATMEPSSSSLGPDYMASGRLERVGDRSRVKVELALEEYDAMLHAKAKLFVEPEEPAAGELAESVGPSVELPEDFVAKEPVEAVDLTAMLPEEYVVEATIGPA
ncbi:hypothetical protein Nepgr_016948 [Nepenthes gracilis]|uniref:Uncharacterized protein n=1 Tax=Nepenthes gracilis TaxID=150966 RepID=A0AAD3SRH6_NEPGR|nr:hypothetical protein Nepgr_016948 [Nepenthes gracilis]